MKKLALAAVLFVAAGACSSVSPRPIRAGELCFRCKRVIVDTRVAAQTIDGGLASNFRSPGCVARYLAGHPSEQSVVFVTDYESSKLVPVASAVFVQTLNRDTGEVDFAAYTDQKAAAIEAAKRNTSPVAWAAVLDWGRSAERGN